MALGYPQHQPLQYNPFRKTSFGFGVGALQNLPNNPFPNATDYAKVIITVDDATHWDDSGHIQTAEVGTAVSTYSSETFIWEVEGERNDVETILADLVFYPPAYQPLTDWRPTALKENDATGSYTDEEPADTVAVPDTFMEITVYNSSGWVTAYDIHVDAVDPVYNNPRPYFTSTSQIIDISHPDYDDSEGKALPIELIIENADDEENLEVKAEFLRASDGTQYTGTGYGVFTDYQDYYVGGKKGIVQNTTDKRFNFVGKKAECNAFLSNLEFTATPSVIPLIQARSSFILRTTVTDGQVGSYVDNFIWHSDTNIEVSQSMTDQSYNEDTGGDWDFGVISFPNLDEMGEVDTFTVTITLATEGGAFFFTNTTVDSQSFSNGVLTITDSDYTVLIAAMRDLTFIPKRDYNAQFDFTIDFEFSSTTYGTSYTSNTISLIAFGQPSEELSFRNTTHSFVEDFRYDLNNGSVPQIIHPLDDDFQIDFEAIQSGVGEIKTFNTAITFTQIAPGHTRFSGTRDQVNAALNQAYFAPNPDVNGTVEFIIGLERTSGGLTYHQTTVGRITLIAADRSELTLSNPGPLDWEEDVSLTFDSGIDIVDDATTQLYLPAYGTEYTAIVRLRDPDGNQFTDGVVTSPNKNLLTSHNNYGDIFTMTGSRSAINTCLRTIKFIPNIDWEGYDRDYVDADYVDVSYVAKSDNFFVDFHIQRDYDSVVLLNYTYVINFNDPTTHEETSYTPTIIADNVLQEDTALSFNTGLQILDKATENTDYSLYDTTYTLETRVLTETLYVEDDYVEDVSDTYSDEYSYVQKLLPATDIIIQTSRTDLLDSYSGTGTVADPFIMNATKSNMNICLSDMIFSIAEVDREPTNSWWILQHKLYRTQDSKTYYDYDIKTIIGALQPKDEVTFTQQDSRNWYINDPVVFSSGLDIIDASTENELYPNYYNTTWTVEIKSQQSQNLYVDNGYVDSNYVEDISPVDNIRLTTTRADLLDSISGTGRGYDYVTMTGSRSAINTCLDNLKMIPDIDWTTDQSFYFTFKITRNADNITYYDHNASITFNATSARDLFVSNVADMYNFPDPKPTIQWIPYDVGTLSCSINGNLFEINDRITEHPEYTDYYNTQYLLKFRLKQAIRGPMKYNRSDAFAGTNKENFAELYNTSSYQSNTQGGIGSLEDPFYFYGSRQQILDLLNNLKFKIHYSPFDGRGWSNGYMYIELYLERVYDSVVLSNWQEVAIRENIAASYTVEDVFDKLLEEAEEWLLPLPFGYVGNGQWNSSTFRIPATFDLFKNSDTLDYLNYWKNKIYNQNFELPIRRSSSGTVPGAWIHPDDPNGVTLSAANNISDSNDTFRDFEFNTIYSNSSSSSSWMYIEDYYEEYNAFNQRMEPAGNKELFRATLTNSVSTPTKV